MPSKVCPKCKEGKPTSAFYNNKNKKDGCSSYCKECNRVRHLEWAQKPASRKALNSRQRVYTLKKKYGLTPEQYQELYDKQEGCCAICERHSSEFKVSLAVDHIHQEPGYIRGLLCWSCNRHLIGKHTDAELFRKAAAYLDQHTGLCVPPDQVKPKRKRRRRKHG